MRIVVLGGSGLIGSKLVNLLRQEGQDVVSASHSSGLNTVTGEGFDEALAGAQVVVDVTNSPSFEDQPAMDFFENSGRHIVAAEVKAGVTYHVALSVVGTDRLQENGYFRAKLAQPAATSAIYQLRHSGHATQVAQRDPAGAICVRDAPRPAAHLARNGNPLARCDTQLMRA